MSLIHWASGRPPCTSWITGASVPANGLSLSSSHRAQREAGEVEDDLGLVCGERRLHEAHARAFLERRDHQRHRRQALPLQLGTQGLQHRRPGALERRAIKQQRHGRPVAERQFARHAAARRPIAEAREGLDLAQIGDRLPSPLRGGARVGASITGACCPPPRPSPARGRGAIAESSRNSRKRIRVLRPARGKQRHAAVRSSSASKVERPSNIGSGTASPGQQRQPEPPIRRQRRQLVYAIRPVRRAARAGAPPPARACCAVFSIHRSTERLCESRSRLASRTPVAPARSTAPAISASSESAARHEHDIARRSGRGRSPRPPAAARRLAR